MNTTTSYFDRDTLRPGQRMIILNHTLFKGYIAVVKSVNRHKETAQVFIEAKQKSNVSISVELRYLVKK